MSYKYVLSCSLWITLSLIISSCSHRLKNDKSKQTIIYPLPPEEGRIQYLTSFSTSKDITPKQSAFAKSVVGEKPTLLIIKPYGVFLRNGKLYVCDVNAKGLEILDLKNRTFEYFVPSGQNKLKLALNCFIDTDDTRYIVDVDLKKIAVFDGNGQFLTSFAQDCVKPTDVFIHGDKIWVVDFGNSRVNVYNKSTYAFEYYLPNVELGDTAYLYKPTNIFVTNDKVYVTDMGQGSIKIYTHQGKYVNTVGKYGLNIGNFVRPKGIAVDRENNLYVVDASFENVQIFDKDGNLLLFFGGTYAGPGDMWLPTKVTIDYDNLQYFEKYVDPDYKLQYLVIVANQFGPDKINVYGRVKPIKVNVKFTESNEAKEKN